VPETTHREAASDVNSTWDLLIFTSLKCSADPERPLPPAGRSDREALNRKLADAALGSDTAVVGAC